MMKIKNIFLYLFLFSSITALNYNVSGQFLTEEDNIKQDSPSVEEKKLPVDIVKNIKANTIADIKGAVRITWEVNKEANTDYIVGRSTVILDSMDKVLKSDSIKVVPAGGGEVAIDSKLPSGAYYYCVISKKMIMDKNIILYPDMNYTTIAAIIEEEKEVVQEVKLPRQVSLINARAVNQQRVLITWKGIDTQGIVYTVYRGKTPFDSPPKFQNAEKLVEIADGRESYIDKNITRSHTYFYAVTTKDVSGFEDLNLIPDQSYTEKGVYINIGSSDPVVNIEAKPLEDGSVLITWEKTSTGILEYLIYKYIKPISDTQRIELSSYIGKADGDKKEFIDTNPGLGTLYYAVLSKMGNGELNNKLIRGSNFTTEPVIIGEKIAVTSISADVKGNDIEITWRSAGSVGVRNYKIVRSNKRIESLADIEQTQTLASVNVFDQAFTDEKLPSGKYYYAIVPETIDENSTYKLEEGINVINGAEVLEKKKTVLKPEQKEEVQIETPIIIEEKKPEKKITKKKQPKKVIEVYEVDTIIKKYFLANKYKLAINELEKLLKISENEYEAAKAKLFIGRSLVELKRYREALDYFLLDDVKKHFPDDAKFWMEFSVSKIQHYSSDHESDNFSDSLNEDIDRY